MSTYWHFQCLDHEPKLLSKDEFTQHTGDQYFFKGIELALNRPIKPIEVNYRDTAVDVYFNKNAHNFLSDHPNCNIGLVSEYGEEMYLETAMEIAKKDR